MKKYILFLLCAVFLISGTALAATRYYPSWTFDATVVPEGVTTIESEAFSGDTALETMLFRENVQSIGANAFAGCTGLTKVCILNNDIVLAPGAFGSLQNDLEIWGYKNTNAENFAKNNGFVFVPIYDIDVDGLLTYAHTRLGEKYVPRSLDCILYARACYLNACNIRIPADCRSMHNLLGEIDTSLPENAIYKGKNGVDLMASQNLSPVRIDDIADLQPGDIMCFRDDTNSYCSHVTIYVGEGDEIKFDKDTGRALPVVHYNSGLFIEASSSGGHVQTNHITNYYVRNFLCAWRITM